MSNQTQSVTKTEFRIHPATLPGHVHLTVADLDNQIKFYEQVIGLKLHWRKGGSAGLGVGNEDMLRLTEVQTARRYPHTTGMYHFAILLPNRHELARAIARLFAMRYPNYPTDHIMTKTTYLDDPEGNNIELYTESPEDGSWSMDSASGENITRRADGTLSDGREPLDIEALFRELSQEDRLDQPMPSNTRIGHYHLYVANLEDSRRFYHEVLGFDDMGAAPSFRMGMASAGRYHHHIGYNTWMGEGAPPAPANSLGLRYITFVLPTAGDLDLLLEHVRQANTPLERTENGWQVRDPSQNALVFTSKS
ncbi:MAG TPA: VOC family protein [Anaerolineales bacterium]|jgi:catechol 2,3-dioxygenase|nr:VOC family protein [Anaerolineales bacterium]